MFKLYDVKHHHHQSFHQSNDDQEVGIRNQKKKIIKRWLGNYFVVDSSPTTSFRVSPSIGSSFYKIVFDALMKTTQQQRNYNTEQEEKSYQSKMERAGFKIIEWVARKKFLGEQ